MYSDLFFDTSSDDEDEVNSELAMFTEACQAAYEASKPKVHRTTVEKDRYGAHDRLVMAYFSEQPQYDEATFRERFRMSRRLFTKIVREVTDASQFFQEIYDCRGQHSISALMKCTSAIRQMAYGAVPDSLDEYLQMGATTARDSLQIFCKVIMNLYGEEFLRKPTYIDIEKLYAYHNEKHGFPEIVKAESERDHYGAHDHLVIAYFSEHPQYDEATFRERFRMSRILFTKIVSEVTDASHFFQERYDCKGQRSISALMKCTSAIRQMAYGAVPDSLDEYLQMGATTARDSLQIFCKVIMNLYGEEFLRKPTYIDIEKLYAYHNEKHGFPEMLGSIDYPFILLEAIASNDLWIWHAFFGVSGMNNDVNVLRQSPIFNYLKSGRAPDVPFVVNNVPYKRGYYLTDGIYPQWSVLIKSIKNPGTNDHKRILYKTKHEAARKDVERAFGVLKQKWKIIKYPARGLTQKEQHRDDDPIRTHAESMQVTQEIIDRTAHLSLKADLVEHIWNNAN
ncbi:ALP1-like protein [Tanacetum coccineum]